MLNRRGITLVEVLFILLIVGIVVAATVPNFIAAENNRKNGLTADHARILQQAAEQFKSVHGSYAEFDISLTRFLPEAQPFANAFNSRLLEPSNRSQPGSISYRGWPDDSTYLIIAIGAKGDTILRLQSKRVHINGS